MFWCIGHFGSSGKILKGNKINTFSFYLFIYFFFSTKSIRITKENFPYPYVLSRSETEKKSATTDVKIIIREERGKKSLPYSYNLEP